MITRYEYKEKVPTNAPRIEDHSKEPRFYTPKPVVGFRDPNQLAGPKIDTQNIFEAVIMDAAEFLDALVSNAEEDLQEDIEALDYEQYYDDVLEYNNQVEEYNAAIKGAVAKRKEFVPGFSKLEQLRRFWP